MILRWLKLGYVGVRDVVRTVAEQFSDLLTSEEAAGNANVFYDPSDLSSLFDGRNTESFSTTVEGNPSVGGVVGTMMDTSQMGGKTADEYIAENAISVTGLAQGALNLGNFTQDYSDGLASSFSVGDYIVIKFTISNYTSGTLQVGTGNQNTTTNRAFNNISGNGTFYKLWKATAVNIAHRTAGSGFVGTFNIDVVAKIPGHHAIAPDDNARPVLFDDPDLTAAALTDNGQRGEELVTNGTFDGNVTGWRASGSATVSYNSGEDAAEIDVTGSGAGIQDDQTITVEPGSEYEVTAVVKSGTYVGDINYVIGGVNTVFSLTGDYVSQTRTITATTNDLPVQLSRATATTGTWYVQSISVRKVLTAFDERGVELVTNGTFDSDISGWTDNGAGIVTFTSGEVTVERTSGYPFIYQTIDVVAGKSYELQADFVRNSGSGEAQLAVRNGLAPSGAVRAFFRGGASSGKISGIFTAPATETIYLEVAVAVTTASVTFDNISVKQVLTPNLVTNGTFDTDSDWDKGTGWSIGSGVASKSGGSSGDLDATVPFVSSGWHLVRWYQSLSAGGITPSIVGGDIGEYDSSSGWKSVFLRAGAASNTLRFNGNTASAGSIDNVIVQELPASIDRKYYLDTDGSDDWMQVTPTLNLGEQWWHVGGWQVDAANTRPFATSTDYRGALQSAADNATYEWRDGGGGRVDLINYAPTEPHVVTVEQDSTNSISGRANGANSAGTITPYDDSGAILGLALFSQTNSAYTAGLDGRFYGGAWGQGQVDYDELTVLQDYLGTTTQPPIDPPDVTEYADVYELLAAQTGAVLFDIDDTTSLRVGRDGSGGVPVDGDPVGMMIDVSDTGGQTMAAKLASQPELVTDGWTLPTGVTQDGNTFTFSNVALSDRATATGIVTSGEWYKIVVTWSDVTTGGVRIDAEEFNSTGIATTGASGTAEVIWNVVSGNGKVAVRATSANTTGTFTVSIKPLSGYVAIAPSDSARPTLASVLDTTASELTDDGTRGEELVTNGGFDTGDTTSWGTYGAGASFVISSGAAILSSSSGFATAYNILALEIGSEYEVSVELPVNSSASGGYHAFRVATNSVFNQNVTTLAQSTGTISAGTYTTTFRALASTMYVGAQVNAADASITFDNVSVRKVNTVFDGRGPELTDAETVGANYVAYEFPVVNGETYEPAMLINASNDSEHYVAIYSSTAGNGSLITLLDGTLGGVAAVGVQYTGPHFVAITTGTWHIRVTPKGGTGSSAGLSVTPSVKKVLTPNLLTGDDSTFGTDTGNWTKSTATISGGVANIGDGVAAGAYIYQDNIVTGGKWYYYAYYIASYTSGSHRIRIGSEGYGPTVTSTGWHTGYLRAVGSTPSRVQIQGLSTPQFIVDNVIVQEVPASVARAHYLDFDGSDDNLILDADTIAASSNATLYKTFRGDSTDVRHMMFGTNGGPFILTAENNTLTLLSATSLGSPVYREDGSIAPYVTRSDVYTALIDNTDHTIGVEEADLSADATWTSSGFYIGGEHNTQWDSTGRLYAWAAVDTRLDGRGRDLLENFMIGKKTS